MVIILKVLQLGDNQTMSGLFSAKEPQKSNVTQVAACKNLAFNTRSLIFWLQKHIIQEFSRS